LKPLVLQLHTDRLLIRNLRASDVTDFHFYRSNPEIVKYQGFGVYSIDQAREFICEQIDKKLGVGGEWVQYGLEHKQTKKLIGDCAIKLHREDIRIGEIGITISHAEQQKGYAREAMTAILDFLFSIDEFHRVIETVDAENKASIQLLKNLGFRQEGHFIENIFFKGAWGSEMQFAMLRAEWETRNAKTREML
jgi:RimJ/RimL family protein N-acetyltransferase